MKSKLTVLSLLVLIITSMSFAQTNFYVSTTGHDGAPGDGLSSSTSWQTIQYAIDHSSGSDIIINVAAGTYDEDVTINVASLTLLGAGASVTNIRGVIGGPSTSTVAVAANNVTVSGFTITRLGNNTADWNNTNGTLNLIGISIQGPGYTGILIHDNIITKNRTGIDINNSSGHTIRNNVITDNRTGMVLRNQTDNLTVVENEITNNWTVGIVFLDASNGSNSPVQTALNCNFSNNNISGNWYGQIVDRQTGGSLPASGANLKNFTKNWFGTAIPVVTTANSTEPGYPTPMPVEFGGTDVPPITTQPTIAGTASANFVFSPNLTIGTDINVVTTAGRGTFGFQGDLTQLSYGNISNTTIDNIVASTPSGSTVDITTSGPLGHIIYNGTGTVTLNNASGGIVTITGGSPALTVFSGTLVINGFTFTTTTNDPTIYVTGGNLKIRNSTIIASTGSNTSGIRVEGSGVVDAGASLADPGNNNFITTTGVIAFNNTHTTVNMNAIGNWWGDASGPHNAATNLSGNGGAVSNNVYYTPWWGTSGFTIPTLQSPVLNTPAINASNIVPGTDFRWSSVPGPGQTITYGIQVSTDQNFTDGSQQKNYQENVVGTAFTPTLSRYFYNTNYYWRVRTEVGTIGTGSFYSSPWSTPWEFTTAPLTPPVLILPASTISGISILPNFTWSWSGTGTVAYDIKIFDSDGTTELYNKNCGVNTHFQLQEINYTLLNNHKYFWTVTVIQGTDSTVSSPIYFTTSVSAVATLSSPSSSTTVYTYTPVFYSWYIGQEVGSLTFQLQYIRDLDLISGHTSPQATDWAGSFTVNPTPTSDLNINTETLNSGTKYWWRVITLRGSDVISYSSASGQWFKTSGGASSSTRAIPSSPTGGVTVYSNSPVLYWYTNSGDLTDITFVVQISTNSGFTSIIDSSSAITDLSYTAGSYLHSLNPGTLYYWRVISYYKKTATFYTQKYIPTTYTSFTTNGIGTVLLPILSYPLNITIYNQSPTFYWYLNAFTSGITYQVYIDGSLNGSSSIDQLYYTTSSVLLPGVHHWYIIATNGTPTQDQTTAAGTFTIAGGIGQGKPIASWPFGNPTVYGITPTFYWYVTGSTLGLTKYTVAWSTSNLGTGGAWQGLASHVDIMDLNQLSYTLLSGQALNYGQPYYWAIASFDGTSYSIWSVGSFTTAGTAGSIVPIVSFPKSGTIYSTSATLSWYVNGSTAGIDHYEVIWSSRVDYNGYSDDNSTTFVRTTTDQSYPITNLIPGTTYHWAVRSNNGTAFSSYSSPEGTFVVAPTASASVVVPLVGSPNNNVSLSTTSPTISWVIPAQTSAPLNYNLQYSTKIDFSDAKTISGISNPSQIITGLQKDQLYYWRVCSTNAKGQFSAYSEVGTFVVNTTTAVEKTETIPTQFALEQNYPNPFNPTTMINYSLPNNAFVILRIYDMLGREIKTLVNNQMSAGKYSIAWKGEDNNGNKVTSGIYIYRISAGNFSTARKMVVLK